MSSRTLRASEIGSYLFCQRAWWYQRQGAPSANVAEFAYGSDQHARHGAGLRWAARGRGLALILLALAAVLLLLQALS